MKHIDLVDRLTEDINTIVSVLMAAIVFLATVCQIMAIVFLRDWAFAWFFIGITTVEAGIVAMIWRMGSD